MFFSRIPIDGFFSSLFSGNDFDLDFGGRCVWVKIIIGTGDGSMVLSAQRYLFIQLYLPTLKATEHLNDTHNHIIQSTTRSTM